MCLDSIHDPSVCHCHSNSQKLQQDGKLHYHRSISMSHLCSLSPRRPPLFVPPALCPPVHCLGSSSHSLLPLLYECVCSLFSALPLSFFLFLFSFIPSPPPPLSMSLSVSENMHRLRKLQSLYSFLIMSDLH